MRQLTPTDLQAWLDDKDRQPPVLLDVREPHEFKYCRIEGSRSMPMASVPARLAELERAAPVVVICHHGGRSMQVAMFLEQQGFAEVINLAGGVNAWSLQVDSSMPRY